VIHVLVFSFSRVDLSALAGRGPDSDCVQAIVAGHGRDLVARIRPRFANPAMLTLLDSAPFDPLRLTAATVSKALLPPHRTHRIEIVPGFLHNVCFTSTSALAPDDQFAAMVLAGRPLYCAFFAQRNGGHRIISLTSEQGTLVVIIHDDAFLRRIARLEIQINKDDLAASNIPFTDSSRPREKNYNCVRRFREQLCRHPSAIEMKELSKWTFTGAGIPSGVFLGFAIRSFCLFYVVTYLDRKRTWSHAVECQWGVPLILEP
jgi:hypothetical protein